MFNSNPIYTETFLQFLENNSDFLNNTIKFGNTTREQKFKEMIISMYDDYEIAYADEQLFAKMFTDTFNQYKDFFIETLDTYEKQYDIDDINKRINDTNTTPNLTETHIDLPRTVASQEHPTTKDTTTGTSNTHTEIQDKENLISLKNQYLRQIRNIYREFGIRFNDLFIHLF